MESCSQGFGKSPGFRCRLVWFLLYTKDSILCSGSCRLTSIPNLLKAWSSLFTFKEKTCYKHRSIKESISLSQTNTCQHLFLSAYRGQVSTPTIWPQQTRLAQNPSYIWPWDLPVHIGYVGMEDRIVGHALFVHGLCCWNEIGQINSSPPTWCMRTRPQTPFNII